MRHLHPKHQQMEAGQQQNLRQRHKQQSKDRGNEDPGTPVPETNDRNPHEEERNRPLIIMPQVIVLPPFAMI